MPVWVVELDYELHFMADFEPGDFGVLHADVEGFGEGETVVHCPFAHVGVGVGGEDAGGEGVAVDVAGGAVVRVALWAVEMDGFF